MAPAITTVLDEDDDGDDEYGVVVVVLDICIFAEEDLRKVLYWVNGVWKEDAGLLIIQAVTVMSVVRKITVFLIL